MDRECKGGVIRMNKQRFALTAIKGAFCFMRAIRETLREVCSPGFLGHQKCKVCGRRDKFDFDVADDVWEAVVPERLQNCVVCP